MGLDQESSAIAFVKSLEGLSFPLSESTAMETFAVDVPSGKSASDTLLELARSSSFVKGYGTTDRWDPADADEWVYDVLYPDIEEGSQGWWAWEDISDWPDNRMIYYGPDGEEKDDAGQLLQDKFIEATRSPEGMIVYNVPDPVSQGAGVYIFSGVDKQSGKLVGVMLANVLT